jgi:hypothetical protein
MEVSSPGELLDEVSLDASRNGGECTPAETRTWLACSPTSA